MISTYHFQNLTINIFAYISNCPTMPKWHESDYDIIGPIEHIYGKKSSAYQNSRLTPLASRL